MKRFISYILAVTMIISMFGSLTAIGNDEPVTTVYQAEDALIGTAGTIVSSKLSVALDSTNGLKYYVAGTDAIMAIAYDLGKISAGDIVDVTMNFNITDFGAMQQSLYILPEDIYTELSEKSIKDYYPDFESVYGDYRAAVSESLDSSNVISKTWSTDSITNVTAEMDGQLIACVTGIRNGGKLTSFVKKFDVSIISNSEGPIETNPPQATEMPTIEPTHEPTATEVPTIEPTQEPHETETPSAKPTQEPTEETTPKPEEGVTWAGSIEELTEALKINNTIIKLYKDIDLGTIGLKTSCVTYVDLNGHTLTSNTSAVIEMVYDLTILDTGATKGALKNTNSSTSYGIKCAAKNVTLNVEGAEIDAASQAIMLNGANSVVNLKGNAVINGGAHAINAGANGTLNIESAVINSDESYKGYVFSASGAVVTIENGTFNYNGTMSSIVVSGKSNITINGGAFTNPNSKRGVINNAKGYSGTLTINGGTFENTNSGGYSILDGDEATTATPPVINITGGNFKSAIGFTKPNNTTTEIIITGGSFIFDPKQYIDENIYAAVNKDGMYTVVDKSEITETPKPSATPIPTAPPNPTDIPKPTVTPNSTNTPKPTVTPEPSDTPKPTVTPGPAGTPKPVATPKPTETVTPQATPTGMPTFTPVVKPTSKPSIWGPDEPVISNASSGGGGGGGISSAPLPPLVPKATSKPEIDISDLKGDTAEITKATQYPIVDSNDAWFTDVFENQWYYDYVKYAVDNGLMSGMSDTEFGSEINIQRCMFVTVLYRMDGEPDSTEDIVFTDVPENAYFKKAVSWANTNGIVSGYSDDEFAPDENITREQLATIIWRYARYKGIDISSENDNALNYDDTREISDYAIPAMKWIIGVGIIGGFDDNTLRPKDNTTRAQTATILKKFNDVYNVIK